MTCCVHRSKALVTMKNKPCVFCGSVEMDNPRTKGHVLQKSMYPETGAEGVTRIVLPECLRCKAIWQNAEDNFRSLMVLAAADDNHHAEALWNGPIRRAHGRELDGKQRKRDLFKWTVTKKTPEGETHTLYLANIENVHLVIRKMVRGLCHHHGLGTQVKDHQVLVMGQYLNEPPDGAEAVAFNHVPGVFRYSFFHRHLQPDVFHVTWLLTFYEKVSFISLVSAPRVKGFEELPL
jgi:hypothetical protein